MKRPEEVKREFVRQWARKAAADLRAAQRLLDGGADFAASAAYHAQQAGEKFLKAILVWHQVGFPKTHDIGRLVDLIGTADASFADRVREAVLLTPYGVETRYPGELPDPSADEARGAIAVAERIAAAVTAYLPDDLQLFS